MIFKKIIKEEFEKLKVLFPSNNGMWEKYKKIRVEQLEKNEIDVFVIEKDNKFIGEITVNYKNTELETETIPNRRVYFEAFRIHKEYQNQKLGQKLINYCLNYLIDFGYTEFTIGVEENNIVAKHIYSKLGFNQAIDKGKGNEFDPTEYTLYLKDITDKNLYKSIKKLLQENFKEDVASIIKVTGGLSHRMYKVTTNKNIYAIKELNPIVMKRKEAYSNFVFSEKVTDIVIANGINAIRAIKIENDIMKKIDNSFFMIFKWVDGDVLRPEEITENHCIEIGKILAEIHNIDFSKIEDEERKFFNIREFEWKKYLELAKKEEKSYAKMLEENIELLYDLNKKANKALKYANQNLCISHRDLDRKNVMWKNDKPVIIDWEASGYVNPTIELIQVAWYWSGGDVENIDYEKFELLINSYKECIKIKIDKNVEELVYADNYGGLEWLDYNLKRALCIENKCDTVEITLAEKEINQSIIEIKYNMSQMRKIIEILNKFEG